MDNVITGTDCDNKSLEYYSLSRRYLQEAGMNLRQWTSNSEALNRKAQEDHIYKQIQQQKSWDSPGIQQETRSHFQSRK